MTILNEDIINNRLSCLNQRKAYCCCKYCGSALEIRRVAYSNHDDARVELYCPQCEKIEFGVEKEIYAVAEYYVDELEFDIFDELDNSLLKKQMNIAKVAEIISWGFVNLGYVNEFGFYYPVKTPDLLLHESLHLKMQEWEKYKQEVFDDTID